MLCQQAVVDFEGACVEGVGGGRVCRILGGEAQRLGPEQPGAVDGDAHLLGVGAEGIYVESVHLCCFEEALRVEGQGHHLGLDQGAEEGIRHLLQGGAVGRQSLVHAPGVGVHLGQAQIGVLEQLRICGESGARSAGTSAPRRRGSRGGDRRPRLAGAPCR